MNANSLSMSGYAEWLASPLALVPPQRLGASLAALGPMATAQLKVQQFLDALRGFWRKPPSGGGPDEPEEEQATGSIWDDPALWLLLMH